MAISTGSITLSDVVDGTNGTQAVVSNENHTFAANATGAVTTLSGFSSDFTIYVGTTKYTYANTNAAPGSGQWNFCNNAGNAFGVGTLIFAGVGGTGPVNLTGSATLVNTTDARLTLLAGTPTTDDFVSGGVNSPTGVNISAGIAINGIVSGGLAFTKITTLSKSVGGSAPFVFTTPGGVIVSADANNALYNATAVVNSAATGSAVTVTAQTGSSFTGVAGGWTMYNGATKVGTVNSISNSTTMLANVTTPIANATTITFRQPDTVFSASPQNFTGTVSINWAYSVDGGPFNTITATQGTTSTATTTNDTLTVSAIQFAATIGNGRKVTYRSTASTDATKFDTGTIYLISSGLGLYQTTVTSTNGNQFKNLSGSTVLTASLYNANTQVTVGISGYNWKKNGTTLNKTLNTGASTTAAGATTISLASTIGIADARSVGAGWSISGTNIAANKVVTGIATDGSGNITSINVDNATVTGLLTAGQALTFTSSSAANTLNTLTVYGADVPTTGTTLYTVDVTY